MTAKPTLKITEIYPSIQGESSFAGYPCTFIRLTGCPLRCRWCDTAYAFEGGKSQSIDEILEEVKKAGVQMVELTGGEPLAQADCAVLASRLVADGYKVLIETGGSEPIEVLPKEVHVVLDVKCPGSKMDDRNLWTNLDYIKPTDDVKFVLADRADYEWALKVIAERGIAAKANILFSCAFGLLQPKDVAEWMVQDKVTWRLQLQMHKYIWHPRAKGV